MQGIRPSFLGSVLAVLVAAGACSGSSKKRPVGSTCDTGEECAGGLCYAGRCLDPDGDDDRDGLVNALEVALGTDPSDPDSDRDEVPDKDEVDANFEARDSDGDGLNDALDSRSADQDDDCLVDELDPENTTPNPNAAAQADRIATACGTPHGVCAAATATLGVTCPNGPAEPVCYFAGVPNHETDESACDELDNDCDGTTDEDCAPLDPLTVGLVGAWPLDGDGKDASPNGDDGVVSGATPAPDRFGVPGRALRFSAVGDRVTVASTHHPKGEVTATYTAWVKPDSDRGAATGILAFGDVLVPNRRSSLVLWGRRSCLEYTGEQNDFDAMRACAPDGRWSFVAAVKEDRHVWLYFNARLLAEGDLQAGQDIQSTLLQIGLSKFSDTGVYEQFYGAIDDVRAWSRALSADELAGLYHEGGWSDVGTAENPAASCLHVRDGAGVTENGAFWIASGESDKFQAYCDMTTDGGGWTLAWVYGFTHPTEFNAMDNAVTPIPTWNVSEADAPRSSTPPSDPKTKGAIPFERWAGLGNEIMLRSDLLDTIACTPLHGSLVDRISGDVACRAVEEKTATCDGTLPGYLGWGAHGPYLNARSLYFYFDGATTIDWPTHDPCGANAPPAPPLAADLGGAVYLRDTDTEVTWPATCANFAPGDRGMTARGLIDPDGPGGHPPFDATCDFTTERGGWTLLTDTLVEIIGERGARPRQYLFKSGDAWYRSPITDAVWSWDGFAPASGHWVYDGPAGEGAFDCSGGATGDYGVGCGGVAVEAPRVLPVTPHDESSGRICQSPPNAFQEADDGCAADVTFWVRGSPCMPDPGSLLGDGDLAEWAAQEPGDPFTCWSTLGPNGPRDAFDADFGDFPPGGAAPSLVAANPVEGNDIWAVILNQQRLTFEAGRAYHLGFWAKSAAPRAIRVFIQTRDLGHAFHWEDVQLDPEWTYYEIGFVADATSYDAMLDFQLAEFSTAKVWLDDIVLVDDGPSPCVSIGAEAIADPGFAYGRTCWTFGHDQAATSARALPEAAEGAADGHALRVEQNPGADPWQISLQQFDLVIEPNRHYRFVIRARASAPRSLFAGVHGAQDEFLQYWTMPVGTSWETFEFDFVTSADPPAALTVELQLGDKGAATMWLDSVSLVDIEADPCHAAGDNLLSDGDFSSGLACWTFGYDASSLVATAGRDLGTAPVAGDAPSLRVAQAPGDVEVHRVGVSQGGLTIAAGRWYRFGFWARAASAREIRAAVWQTPGAVFTYQAPDVDTTWRHFEYDFVASESTDPGTVSVSFHLADATGATVWLDGVTLRDMGPSPCVADAESLLEDGELAAGTLCWNASSAAGIYAVSDDHPPATAAPSLAVTNTQAGNNLWDVQLIQRGFHIEAGVPYTLGFWAKAAAPRSIVVLVHNWDTGIQQMYEVTTLGTAWTEFRFDFDGETTEDNVLVEFQFGQTSTETVWVDGITLATRGLLSHWAFDEGAGTIATDGVGVNDGTITGNATWASGADCPRGGCLRFDGGVAVQAGTSGLPVGNAPRTVALWMKPEKDLATSTEAALAQWGTAANGQMFGLINSLNDPGKLYFYGHNADLSGGPSLQSGVWYHAAVTYDGVGVVHLYLDGAEVAAQAIPLSTAIDANGMTIGWRPASTHWTGLIDDVRVYDRALAPSEIRGLAGVTTPP